MKPLYSEAVVLRECLQRGFRPRAEMLDYLCRSKRTELGGGAMVLTASDSDEKSRCEQIAGASGINELVDWRGFHDFVALARHDHTTLFAARHHGEPHVIAQRRGRGVEVRGLVEALQLALIREDEVNGAGAHQIEKLIPVAPDAECVG